jgi:hypothetical protein
MDETLLGEAPRTPMSNAQRRAHKRLAHAEKRLIMMLVWEYPAVQIDAQDTKVRRLTTAWKRECTR